MMRRCGPRPAIVLAKPNEGAAKVVDLVPGEEFAVLDITAGWAWGYKRLDHCVGYLPFDALVED